MADDRRLLFRHVEVGRVKEVEKLLAGRVNAFIDEMDFVGYSALHSWGSLPGSGKLWNPEQVILLTVQICTSNNTFRSLETLAISSW